MDALQKDVLYTYSDYVTWDDDTRYELIHGVPYMLAAPSLVHQRVIGRLYVQLFNFLAGKACEVFVAPVDVRLCAGQRDDTVVQPDLLVVCDKAKLDDKGCAGAPDMVVEILSPSTASRDCIIKWQLYLDAGVKEFWIVDPIAKTVYVQILEGSAYATTAYDSKSQAPVKMLKGCEINLPDLFAE